MEERFSSLRAEFKSDLKTVKQTKDLEQLKVKFLGKKGLIQGLMANLRDLSPEERPEFGKRVNDIKEEISLLCDEAMQSLVLAEEAAQIGEERIDTSLPGRRHFLGKEHPITQVQNEIIEILVGMGFSVQYGPIIDSDYYNFEGLNFAKDHPARDMQDTFYINADMLLRTHTTNTQLRTMEMHKPPMRVIAPGTVFRNENISSRSHVFFHQVDGLYVDKDVSFADLMTTMQQFLNKLFKKEIGTRFRPSYFPFVEPGLEIDVCCTACNGKGCRLCKHSGWLEILGAGMVHPEVLKNGGVNPHEYSGFAWGMGVERLAMLLYGINDIRLFAENDMRFLSQF